VLVLVESGSMTALACYYSFINIIPAALLSIPSFYSMPILRVHVRHVQRISGLWMNITCQSSRGSIKNNLKGSNLNLAGGTKVNVSNVVKYFEAQMFNIALSATSSGPNTSLDKFDESV
jgi:hypothetical protein